MAKKKKSGLLYIGRLRRDRFQRERDAATKLQFGDLERQMGAEQRASNLQLGRIEDYFSGPGGYLEKVRALRGSTQAEYDASQAAAAARTTASSNYEDQLRARLSQEDMANAQLRGTDYNPNQGATLSAAAGLARRNQADNYANLTGSQSAHQFSYLADKERIGEGEKVNQKLKEAARRRSIDADLRNLATKKGAFQADYLRQARGSEREYDLALKNAALQRASLNQKASSSAASLGETTRHHMATESAAQKRLRLDKKKFKAQKKKNKKKPQAF